MRQTLRKFFKIDETNCFAGFVTIVAGGGLTAWGIVEGVKYLLT